MEDSIRTRAQTKRVGSGAPVPAQAVEEKQREQEDAQGGAPIPAPTVAVEGGRRRLLK